MKPKWRQAPVVDPAKFPRPPPPTLLGLIKILRYPPITIVSLNNALLFAAYYAINVTLPQYLEEDYHFTTTEVGVSYMAPGRPDSRFLPPLFTEDEIRFKSDGRLSDQRTSLRFPPLASRKERPRPTSAPRAASASSDPRSTCLHGWDPHVWLVCTFSHPRRFGHRIYRNW